MHHSSLLLGASLLALAACQPAEDAAGALEAEAPPVVAETVEAETVEETVEDVVEITAADDVETVEGDADHAHDEGETHDHGEDEAHDHEEEGHDDRADHDHADDDEHAHEDHDHDHDHAGGEAHVHGKSDLAVSLDGASVSISLEGALANFGLDETIRDLPDTAPYTDGVVALQGGDCSRDSASASIRPIGDHGNLMIDLTYTCAAIDDLTGIDVTGFANFSGFEEVDAVVLTDAGQTADTLTGAKTVLDLP